MTAAWAPLASVRDMELPRPAVVVALLTPYDDGGAPDPGALRAHVDLLVEAGVDALMPGGTTGEGALLSDDELAGVVRATVEAAGGRVPVLAHVGRPGTAPTLALARRALDDGAAARGRASCPTTTRRPTTRSGATTAR